MIFTCTNLLSKINRLHASLRKHNTIGTYELCKFINRLEEIYKQYSYAMILDDGISYACFFTSIDIMNEDLKYLKTLVNNKNKIIKQQHIQQQYKVV